MTQKLASFHQNSANCFMMGQPATQQTLALVPLAQTAELNHWWHLIISFRVWLSTVPQSFAWGLVWNVQPDSSQFPRDKSQSLLGLTHNSPLKQDSGRLPCGDACLRVTNCIIIANWLCCQRLPSAGTRRCAPTIRDTLPGLLLATPSHLLNQVCAHPLGPPDMIDSHQCTHFTKLFSQRL